MRWIFAKILLRPPKSRIGTNVDLRAQPTVDSPTCRINVKPTVKVVASFWQGCFLSRPGACLQCDRLADGMCPEGAATGYQRPHGAYARYARSSTHNVVFQVAPCVTPMGHIVLRPTATLINSITSFHNTQQRSFLPTPPSSPDRSFERLHGADAENHTCRCR